MSNRRNKLLKKTQKYGVAGLAVRLAFNWSTVYRRTGGKVYYASEDVSKISVKINLTRKTRNYVGTIFGGSMFAATDPVYMFQLIAILGEKYVVWDKSSHVTFVKPGKETVYFDFICEPELIKSIKSKVEIDGKYIFTLPIELKTKSGLLVCRIEKEIYVASKEYYQQRKKSTDNQKG